MKLPDFLEQLNQGAEKALGENAKSMIDSLLYDKLPPKLKRSVNMARLENETYVRKLWHTSKENLNLMIYPFPQKLRHRVRRRTCCLTALTPTKKFWKNCPKLKKKKELDAKNGKKTNVRLIQKIPSAAKLITQQRSVGVVPELTFVPNGIDRTLKIQSPPKTKAPSQKLKNLQHLHQENRTQRNLIKKTKVATILNM